MTDFIIQMMPYLIGLLGVTGTFYTIHKTINHQREIKSIEIKKELLIKQVDNFNEAYCEIAKLFDKSNTFISEHMYADNKLERVKQYTELFNLMIYWCNKIDMLLCYETEIEISIRDKTWLIVNCMRSNILDSNDHNTVYKRVVLVIDLMEELLKISKKYIREKHLEINDLLPEKHNRVISWFKKSWKESKGL